MRKLTVIVAAVAVAFAFMGTGSNPAAADGPGVQLTDSPRHDRNESLLITSDGTWWLFFARGEADPPPLQSR